MNSVIFHTFLNWIALACVGYALFNLFYCAYRGLTKAQHILYVWSALFLLSNLWTFKHPGQIYLDHFSLTVISVFSVTIGLLLRNLLINKKRIDHQQNRKEKQTLANILHDEINPNFILFKVELERMTCFLKQIENPEIRDEFLKSIERLGEANASAYKKIRVLIEDSRQEILQSMGFTRAVESLIANYRAALDQPRFELIHDLANRPPITDNHAHLAYLVIQEALLNAVKHAESTKVLVKMMQKKDHIHISIEDDGIGLSKQLNSKGFGIGDMRERLKQMGSELEIKNIKSGGVSVSFTIALR